MSSHIYILTDGVNTKIGITTDIVKRMSSYHTHNATIQLIKKYLCADEEAKRVETAIKSIFKEHQTGKGKEWFSVSPETVDRYVSNLLDKPLTTNVIPSLHGVRLTQEAEELKEKITKAVTTRGESEAGTESKEKLAEYFGNKFSLGIPEHHLPENILFKNNLCIDINHSLKRDESQLIRESIANNFVQMPCDDHVYRFFHLAPLSSGYYIALCTARVSMPYLKRLEAEKTNSEIVEYASELGLYATFHNEWSWWYPDRTALILYQPKTPISQTLKQWESSFKKWVIERQEILKHEPFSDQEALEMAIEDIARDNSFPLEFQTYQELCEIYFKPFLNFGWEEDEPHWQKKAHEFLIEKWKN